MTLSHKGWHKIEDLKNHRQLNEKAERILKAGNEALHERVDTKVRQLINELSTRTMLEDLKIILEYLYR